LIFLVGDGDDDDDDDDGFADAALCLFAGTWR
jgi:hypothetical protein